MTARTATKKRHRETPAVHVGRPPRELAGNVDERILDAARRVFFDRGLAGASINQIARLAHAGKETIYAHYARAPTKDALFEAVMSRVAANWTAAFKLRTPIGATLHERLVSLATDILNKLLASDAIDFARLCVAANGQSVDAPRIGRVAREYGAEAVARALSEVAQGDETAFPGCVAERLPATTERFLDLVVTPILLRAVLGEDIVSLRATINAHIVDSVPFFLAACRCTDVK